MQTISTRSWPGNLPIDLLDISVVGPNDTVARQMSRYMVPAPRVPAKEGGDRAQNGIRVGDAYVYRVRGTVNGGGKRAAKSVG